VIVFGGCGFDRGGPFGRGGLALKFALGLDRAGRASRIPQWTRRRSAALGRSRASDAEVAAITGQSRQMVEHYARAVNQKRLAAAAVLKGRTCAVVGVMQRKPWSKSRNLGAAT
jgi:hypothetical protein